MQEAEQISALIGDIYDAAIDPALWHDVLAEIARFVGGQSAGLGSMNIQAKLFSNTPYTFGCDPHYLRLQIEQ